MDRRAEANGIKSSEMHIADNMPGYVQQRTIRNYEFVEKQSVLFM